MSMPRKHADCTLKNKQKKKHWFTVWANLFLWEQVGLQVFRKSFLLIKLSQSNGQTVPQFGCSIWKRSDSELFSLLLFPLSTLGMLVSWCFEPSQPQRITSGLTLTELVSWCFEPSRPQRITSGLTLTELVSWCFEPSRPQRITSGLTLTELVSWCFERTRP